MDIDRGHLERVMKAVYLCFELGWKRLSRGPSQRKGRSSSCKPMTCSANVSEIALNNDRWTCGCTLVIHLSLGGSVVPGAPSDG